MLQPSASPAAQDLVTAEFLGTLCQNAEPDPSILEWVTAEHDLEDGVDVRDEELEAAADVIRGNPIIAELLRWVTGDEGR